MGEHGRNLAEADDGVGPDAPLLVRLHLPQLLHDVGADEALGELKTETR